MELSRRGIALATAALQVAAANRAARAERTPQVRPVRPRHGRRRTQTAPLRAEASTKA
ncbi:hypothetical protein KTR66_15405 [Roseococcus sp. SDR]|uniref:hypothetical protein n=1 Tax=Roseococcus sp. SDR TaxID=2835532 RepID=UPI001BCF0013|nr:hypothetical protein [Roseococcus sp. SDR]MBS7791388.1 hypothetical protein [Roseococcus sp. SDR]MBV1846702.1 hypothetical protein [Roseococcus sp. SDR]